MKAVSFFLLFAVFQINTFAQTTSLFDIKEVIIRDTTQKKTPADFQRANTIFFEDDEYVVRKTCSGEWGGSIWFKNKKTSIEYSCSATCPVIVNKINEKYIVSNTLNHMVGSSGILEISDPKLLAVFKTPKPRRVPGKGKVIYVGDDESKSIKGANIILDTMGVTMLTSFLYNDQLYHIITDHRKTYLAEIKNKKFVTISTLSNTSIWTNDPEVIKTTDGHMIVFFKNYTTEGFLDIFGRAITITRYH